MRKRKRKKTVIKRNFGIHDKKKEKREKRKWPTHAVHYATLLCLPMVYYI